MILSLPTCETCGINIDSHAIKSFGNCISKTGVTSGDEDVSVVEDTNSTLSHPLPNLPQQEPNYTEEHQCPATGHRWVVSGMKKITTIGGLIIF